MAAVRRTVRVPTVSLLYRRSLGDQRCAFSTQSQRNQANGNYFNTNETVADALFGRTNPNFPLPGNVTTNAAVESATQQSAPRLHVINQIIPVRERSTEQAFAPAPDSQQIIQNLSNGSIVPRAIADRFIDRRRENMEQVARLLADRPERLDVNITECPKLLQKDLPDLFPDRIFKFNNDRPVTIMTVTRKMDNDMSSWSPSVEVERETVTAEFVECANAICQALLSVGYWADFIDPSSGRPYLGKFTNATLFETDERYNKLGFVVEDLGCCKVTKHRLWGAYAFVGTIFTNAPVNAAELQAILAPVAS